MEPLNFDYLRPATLAEAVEALQTPGRRVIAGGTDLILAIKEKKVQPACLVDISGIPELSGIREKENVLEIGAASAFTDIAGNPVIRQKFLALSEAASKVGSPQIRNRGTIGGNLSTGSSAGDTICPLTAFSARVELVGPEGKRILPLEDFWREEGQRGLSESTVLTRVLLETGKVPWTSTFVKLGRRESLAISRLSLTLCLRFAANGTICEARTAVGSAGRHAYRVTEAETLLQGRTMSGADARDVEEALSAAVCRALGTRSTVRYKAQAVQELYRQALDRIGEYR